MRNYADWLVASYGRTFAETFPMVYGRKYHTTEPENLTTEWLGPRMYRPDLEEMLRGALDAPREHKHYVTEFRYPERGRLRRLPGRPAPRPRRPPRTTGSWAWTRRRRSVRLAGGRQIRADAVVSSIPLPELVPLVDGVPERPCWRPRGTLSWTSATVVNVGVDRDDLSPAHITYYYDEDVLFPRLNFPHMFSPHVAPEGAGSIQAEVYHSAALPAAGHEPGADRRAGAGRPAPVRCAADRTTGSSSPRPGPSAYANVIWDHRRADAVATVHELPGRASACCGAAATATGTTRGPTSRS